MKPTQPTVRALLLGFGLSLSPVLAQTPDDLPALLADLGGLITVQNAQGADLAGRAVEVNAEGITLRQELGDGSAEVTYAADEIFRVRLPVPEAVAIAQDWLANGETEAAVLLFEATFAQRKRFFPYLPAAEPPVFLDLAEALVRADTPAQAQRARAILTDLEAWMTTPPDRARWTDLRLLATYLAQDYVAAHRLADAWIAHADRHAPNALGWGIAASLDLRAGQPKAALRHALHPIVFSPTDGTPFLPHAYALAIKAALALEDFPQARRLEAERKTRGLAWPAVIDPVEIPPELEAEGPLSTAQE